MNKKRVICAVCITAAFLVAASSVAVFYFKKDTVKAAVTSSASLSGITDVGDYHKKITIADNHLPSDILSKGGNGLQLFDTKGNFINGEGTLDCGKEFTAFLRVLWMDDWSTDATLMVLTDNHIQPFKVDDKQETQTTLPIHIQPKSSMNIPLTIDAVGDTAQANSNITFLIMYNNPNLNLKGEEPLPNATNSLSYKIQNNQKKDFSDVTLTASNYVKQNDKNATYVQNKSFLNVLSAKNDADFQFYQEKQKLNIQNVNYYAMGQGTYTTLVLLGDKLISPFENKAYLNYTLEESTYLKQKTTFPDYAEGDHLTIIHILQHTPNRYRVDSYDLTKN